MSSAFQARFRIASNSLGYVNENFRVQRNQQIAKSGSATQLKANCNMSMDRGLEDTFIRVFCHLHINAEEHCGTYGALCKVYYNYVSIYTRFGAFYL